MTRQDVAPASTISRTPILTTADWIVLSLAVIGGLNWGLIGAFSFDPVATLLGDRSMLSRITYLLFGLSSIYAMYHATKLVDPR